MISGREQSTKHKLTIVNIQSWQGYIFHEGLWRMSAFSEISSKSLAE